MNMWRLSLLPFLLLSEVSSTLHTSSVLRVLEIGDFQAINNLLGGLSFPLPDQTITQDVAGATLTLDLSSLVCSGLNIGDAQISYQQTSTLDISLRLIQADLTCQARYDYNYLFFNGGGTANLNTQDNALTLNLTLTTGDAQSIMETAPTVSLVGCDSTINIAGLQLDGDGAGVMAELVNVLEFAIKDMLANQIKTFLCDEVSTLENGIQVGLDKLHDILNLNTTMPADPLSAEAALDPKVDWLDFMNPTSWIEKAANVAFSQAKDLLINNLDLVWNGLLDKDGTLVLDIASMGAVDQTISSLLGNFTFRLKTTRIWGLDALSITNLTAIGASTLAAEMSLPSLRGELDCEFEMDAGDKTYVENAVVSIQLDAISVQGAALVAIDEAQLGDVMLGSLLLGKWDCLLAAIKQLAITQLRLDVSAEKPTVTGIVSPGLDRIVQDAVQQLFDTYGNVLNTALPVWIRAATLGLNLGLLASESKNCATMDELSGNEFVDFRDLFLPASVSVEYGGSGTEPYGSIATFAKDYVAELLANESSMTNLTESVLAQLKGVSHASSGVFIWEKALVDYSGHVELGGLDAEIVLKVDQLTVENFASLSHPTILEPVHGEAYQLNNSVHLSIPPSAPLRVSAHVALQIKTMTDQAEMISNEMIVTVEMQSIELVATLLAKILTSRIMEFPVRDMLNWHCWLSTIPAPVLDKYGRRVPGSEATLSFKDVRFSALSMNFTVECLNCSSPKFEELSALLSSPETDENAAASAQNVIDFLLLMVEGDSSVVQTEIDKMLVEAPKFCPHRAEYDPNATFTEYEPIQAVDDSSSISSTYLVTLLVAMAVVGVAVVIICLAVKCIVSRRNRKWLASLPAERICAIYSNQKEQREHEHAMDMASVSLIRSKQLSLFARWFVPIAILGNIALFLSGHLSLGGEVRIYLQIGGQELVVRDFYSFSVAQSGVELWNAGAKALALLMLLFSGVWPYFKQLLTLFLWIVPPRFVSIARRGSILLWLDTLAKWSMIDVFVMIVTIAALQVSIRSPEKPFLPADFYQVDLLVVPLWGLYANMLAQLVSQIASHFIIYYHRVVATAAAHDIENRNCVARDTATEQNVELGGDNEEEYAAAALSRSTSSYTMDDSTKEETRSQRRALFQHAFTRPHRGESETLHVRPWVNVGFGFLCVVTVVLLIVGCVLPSYSFDYLGLVGIAVESGMDFQNAQKFLSVVSTAQLLMNQARFLGTTKDFIGMLSVAMVLVLTALIVPIAQVITIAVEWFAPLSRKVSDRLRVAIEIFLAWQYVEVFLLSVIVAVWQIGDVSTFMVNDYCGNLSGFFAFLVLNGIVNPSDAQCFRAQASINSASYVLIAAAVVLLLLTSYVSKATIQRARDEDSQNERSFAGSSITVCTSDDDAAPLIEKISNVPVLFTDQFRWLLSASD